ncbi:cytochrome P450 [Coprinopsis cinerea okayama7|uniref:Cytochrome P450 n=1 Tax=Coprinopsis cinerea (strain Okayama-7 / 130 / ATCC MYA-4618 / FGSC 9003) TaxID=240176 RepID=A8PCB6_COPC7|nr:cytochrome P450 [Coprinopsis cinerea okayama7\|eukprot:XP_001840358.2 cytochrome P450 [Coprinopsis cinerea okayama7\
MITALLLVVTAFLAWWFFSPEKDRFPGPKGLPIIGSALSLPKERQWLTFEQWRKEYGLIYSDRPKAVMVGELVGWNRGLGYTNGPPNPRFRELRRLFNAFIGPRACESVDIQAVQEEETLKLLVRLLETPDDFLAHIRGINAAVLLRLAYGYHPSAEESDALGLVKIVGDAMDGFSLASEPGWWVDSVPLLRYIPFLPFQYAAKRMRADLERLYQVPFNFVKRERMNGTAKISFISSFLDEKNEAETKEDEDIINAAAASLYSGGAETTVSSLESFFLVMALYPEVQRKAQAEVDRYLGGRSELIWPRISDRPHLPYVEAIMLEILRWNPSVPLSLPHVAREDDIYRGRRIKKGTVVWANMWSILQDPELFPEPRVFKPERYITEEGKLATNSKATLTARAAFGFGRRLIIILSSICPGLYLAENTMFLTFSTLLATFNIAEDPDEDPLIYYEGFIR